MLSTETPSDLSTQELRDLDSKHVVHPFTDPRVARDGGVTIFVRGEGVWIQDSEGKTYLDACAGLTNVNVGYGRERLADVARAEMAKMGYATLFFGASHPSAIKLAHRLADLTPRRINRFFFTVGGSDAVETAIKFARLHHKAASAQRFKILARHRGYHGMSFGALSASGAPERWTEVGPVVPGFVHFGQPGDGVSVDEIREVIEREDPETIAALIAEPISMSANIDIPPDDYWQGVRHLCSEYGILIISDEILTGFGRTGRWFAADHWNMDPDMITISKGLTSGYAPLGAVGLSDPIHQTLLDRRASLIHGFTAGGHPAACAVALENLTILEEEGLVEGATNLGQQLRSDFDSVVSEYSGLTKSVRGIGLITALDFELPQPDVETFNRILRDRGVLARQYDTTLAFVPPLSISSLEISTMATRLTEAMQAFTGLVRAH